MELELLQVCKAEICKPFFFFFYSVAGAYCTISLAIQIHPILARQMCPGFCLLGTGCGSNCKCQPQGGFGICVPDIKAPIPWSLWEKELLGEMHYVRSAITGLFSEGCWKAYWSCKQDLEIDRRGLWAIWFSIYTYIHIHRYAVKNLCSHNLIIVFRAVLFFTLKFHLT